MAKAPKPKAKPKAKRAPKAVLPVLTIKAAAAILAVDSKWIRNLIDSGHVKRTGKGVTERDCWRGWMAYTKDEQRRSTKTASTTRMQDARAIEIELRTRERQGKLLDVEAMTAAVDELLGAMRAGFASLPARLSSDREERERIEREINETIADALDKFERATSAPQSGDGTADADDDEDT